MLKFDDKQSMDNPLNLSLHRLLTQFLNYIESAKQNIFADF